ncbi:MAG TPA: amidohydrolase family protein [Acidobacteriaceae bacterium]|nr:amidohydrolase family protein [Acidobacteriaceae bacterium]
MNRRDLFRWTGMGLVAKAVSAAGMVTPGEEGKAETDAATDSQGAPLRLEDYQPRSMLRVPETHVARAKFPVIDIHTHITDAKVYKNGVGLSAARNYAATPKELLAVMDRKNIRSMVNLTGGYGSGLKETVARYDDAYRDRFYTFTEPTYEKFLEPNYPQLQAQAIEQAHRDGARGLKILKTLGLYLRSDITSGTLVKIDDKRFDPMWDTCGQLKMPVAIHIADPVAFFTPTDRFNERYEELHNHPDWSFYGRDFPRFDALIAARNRMMARHPNTHFIVLHVGNYAENLQNISENLDRFPHMTVDTAARIGELGRQPRASQKFFDKYQDRILFGTDASPHAPDVPQQIFGDRLYEIYYRFFETDDEYFDYAPAPKPPQGRWEISGINLPDPILRKVYNENAMRELGLES